MATTRERLLLNTAVLDGNVESNLFDAGPFTCLGLVITGTAGSSNAAGTIYVQSANDPDANGISLDVPQVAVDFSSWSDQIVELPDYCPQYVKIRYTATDTSGVTDSINVRVWGKKS